MVLKKENDDEKKKYKNIYTCMFEKNKKKKLFSSFKNVKKLSKNLPLSKIYIILLSIKLI